MRGRTPMGRGGELDELVGPLLFLGCFRLVVNDAQLSTALAFLP